MNIPEVWLKFKTSLQRVPEEAILVALIVLVGVSGFGLGRLSALESSREPVRIIAPGGGVPEAVEHSTVETQNAARSTSQAASVKSAVNQIETGDSGAVVASKNSTKYHLPWCSGAKRISEANKITFASKAEAEKAGYTAAANCPGI